MACGVEVFAVGRVEVQQDVAHVPSIGVAFEDKEPDILGDASLLFLPVLVIARGLVASDIIVSLPPGFYSAKLTGG